MSHRSRVAAATLLIFPAWLPHSVAAKRSAQTHISLSFNGMFAAFPESMTIPLWSEC